MVNATSKEVVSVNNASPADEPTVLCIVKDETTANWKHNTHTVNLPASTLVHELYSHVAKQVNYEEDSFLLVWCNTAGGGSSEDEVILNAEKNKSLQEVGLASNGKKNNFLLKDKDGVQPRKSKVGELVAVYYALPNKNISSIDVNYIDFFRERLWFLELSV